jgi:hypothetical protein
MAGRAPREHVTSSFCAPQSVGVKMGMSVASSHTQLRRLTAEKILAVLEAA